MSPSKPSDTSQHCSVLLQESIEALQVAPAGVYLDATFGRGGHTQALLHQLGPQGRVIGIDQDPQAVAYGRGHFEDEPRFEMVHASFCQMQSICEARGLVGQIDGVLMDLGVSSPQLDQAERGFSFMRSGPLDMRMNPEQGPTAEQWVQAVSEQTLVQVLKDYGEERFAKRIARAMKQASAEGQLATTDQLAKLVRSAVPRSVPGKHPATRTFQALRIAVNGELEGLVEGLEQAVQVLKPEGRLAVISFHSLEDRRVKRLIRHYASPRDLYPESPIEIEVVPAVLKKLGKPIFPSKTECQSNPRARSAVLRVAQKI